MGDEHDSERYRKSLRSYYDSRTAEYRSTYSGEGRYRSNHFRLQTVMALVDGIRPRPTRILEAGCGSGMVLLSLLGKGYACSGFDNSDGMRKEARQNLRDAGFSEDAVGPGDIYRIPCPGRGVDLLLCLGVLSNLTDHEQIFSEFRRVLVPGGRIIVSLNNELFSLYSLNRYTLDFYREIFADAGVPDSAAREVLESLRAAFSNLGSGEIPAVMKDAEIDRHGVTIPRYHPLNVGESFRRLGFGVEEVRFYHYHPLPPPFEGRYPALFREPAERLETIDADWRGAILCNAMVVQARLLPE
jgi:ubiquinone/menaquinone biosynthesis C-methylase UbiE